MKGGARPCGALKITLKNLKIDPKGHLAVSYKVKPVLTVYSTCCIYPKEIKQYVHKKTCIQFSYQLYS